MIWKILRDGEELDFGLERLDVLTAVLNLFHMNSRNFSRNTGEIDKFLFCNILMKKYLVGTVLLSIMIEKVQKSLERLFLAPQNLWRTLFCYERFSF